MLLSVVGLFSPTLCATLLMNRSEWFLTTCDHDALLCFPNAYCDKNLPLLDSFLTFNHSSFLMLEQEPTSGLDSSTASCLMTTLKNYAQKSGFTLVMTIHQPSSQIFNMFDKLLLLCEGEVAYYGDVKACADYFADIDLPCPPNYNLADHIREHENSCSRCPDICQVLDLAQKVILYKG